MMRIQPESWAIHRYQLRAPLPIPEAQQALNGEPPPDRGQTYAWPHPTFAQLSQEQQAIEPI